MQVEGVKVCDVGVRDIYMPVQCAVYLVGCWIYVDRVYLARWTGRVLTLSWVDPSIWYDSQRSSAAALVADIPLR